MIKDALRSDKMGFAAEERLRMKPAVRRNKWFLHFGSSKLANKEVGVSVVCVCVCDVLVCGSAEVCYGVIVAFLSSRLRPLWYRHERPSAQCERRADLEGVWNGGWGIEGGAQQCNDRRDRWGRGWDGVGVPPGLKWSGVLAAAAAVSVRSAAAAEKLFSHVSFLQEGPHSRIAITAAFKAA